MRRVACRGQECVEVVDVPLPEPAPDQVLVRTVASALCGSELKAYRDAGVETGNNGHEAAGIIEALGSDVTELEPGMRVGVSAVAGCGECRQCQAGRYTWCKGFKAFGNMHSEYFVIPALACHRLPENVPWEVGVLLSGDGFGVPYHTSTKIRDAAIQTVAIFGLGPIGLGSVLMQSYLGREVIGVDVASERLAYARKLGAGHVLEGGTDAVEQIRELTDGRGADVCIEAVGRPDTARQCFEAVGEGGIVVFNGEQPRIELSPSRDLIRRDIWAVGSWFYHFHEFHDMLELYRQGLDVASLVTHRLPLESAAEAYRLMAEAQCGKLLLDYGEPAD